VLGFGFNTELVARRNLPAPRCWADLLNPRLRGEVQMANPNSSGTAYIVIATLVQMMGEEPAFDYLKRLHGSINAYPRSGTGPITAVARGETAVSISFVHNAAEERAAGFPVGHAVPCEGTGYEIGSMSIIRGARNLANAQRFYHWALSAEAQIEASREARKLQTMANRGVPLTDGAPNMATARIIDYDNARFGASAERRRLLARWGPRSRGLAAVTTRQKVVLHDSLPPRGEGRGGGAALAPKNRRTHTMRKALTPDVLRLLPLLLAPRRGRRRARPLAHAGGRSDPRRPPRLPRRGSRKPLPPLPRPPHTAAGGSGPSSPASA
jgi:hypothetical protein